MFVKHRIADLVHKFDCNDCNMCYIGECFKIIFKTKKSKTIQNNVLGIHGKIFNNDQLFYVKVKNNFRKFAEDLLNSSYLLHHCYQNNFKFIKFIISRYFNIE